MLGGSKVEKKSTLEAQSRKKVDFEARKSQQKVDFALIGPGPRPWTSGWAGWIRISTDLLPNSSLLDSSLNRPRPEVELQSHEKSMVAAKLTMRDQWKSKKSQVLGPKVDFFSTLGVYTLRSGWQNCGFRGRSALNRLFFDFFLTFDVKTWLFFDFGCFFIWIQALKNHSQKLLCWEMS